MSVISFKIFAVIAFETHLRWLLGDVFKDTVLIFFVSAVFTSQPALRDLLHVNPDVEWDGTHEPQPVLSGICPPWIQPPCCIYAFWHSTMASNVHFHLG